MSTTTTGLRDRARRTLLDFRTLAVVVLLAALGLGTGAPASAQDESRPEPFEVESYALDNAVSIAVAEERLIDQRHIPDLIAESSGALGASYGGVYVNNEDGGQINLALVAKESTGEPSSGTVARAEEAIASAGLENEVEIDPTTRSEDKMEDLLAAIQGRLNTVNAEKRLDEPNDSYEPTVDAEIEIPTSKILLSVPPVTTEAQDDMIDELIEGYGQRLRTVAKPLMQDEGCVMQAYCDPPLRGGTRLAYNGAEYCSFGLKVRHVATGNVGITTAGHCITAGLVYIGQGGTWQTKNSNQNLIGIGQSAYWANDIGVVKINNPGYWDPKHWIRTAQTNDYNYTFVANPAVGQHICMAGSYNGSNCGYVTGGFATRDGTPNTFRASYCGAEGDSGGAVYANHVAYGSHVGAYGGCDKIFYAANQIQGALGGWAPVAN